MSQPGSEPAAPVVLARATLAGAFDDETTFNANIKFEDRTISQGVHERWIVLDGTATSEEQSYDLELELRVPSDVTLTVQNGSGGTSLIYAEVGSTSTVVLESTVLLMGDGSIAIVSAEDLATDFWVSGAVTDNNTADFISAEDAYQSSILLTIVASTLGSANCDPQWTAVHGDARDDCKPAGIKSFSYTCNPQTGAVSFSWECKASS